MGIRCEVLGLRHRGRTGCGEGRPAPHGKLFNKFLVLISKRCILADDSGNLGDKTEVFYFANNLYSWWCKYIWKHFLEVSICQF